jgi:hypothetical protein
VIEAMQWWQIQVDPWVDFLLPFNSTVSSSQLHLHIIFRKPILGFHFIFCHLLFTCRQDTNLTGWEVNFNFLMHRL